MKRNIFLSFVILLLISMAVPSLASADSGHARIVRLSFVQGDVRFLREFHEDSLTDPKAVWETAPLNLPIREGNALATGNGRAEVEFENGAMAFLAANTVIEFYDLSLRDGSRITRIVLRQGSASFSDHSVNGDYFSVTGGDFSVEVTERATFRLENFDDGSTVSVVNGHVNVVQNDKSTPLEKGQSLTANAQDPGNQVVAKASVTDDFDRWVAGRVQSEQVATAQLQPAANYNGSYVSGYSDLFTFGSWMTVNGANCWRPFGMGLGWSPFDTGAWFMDAGGWSFIGSSPWGWLPYHYGGWYFTPAYGWVWNPGGLLYGRPMPYRPVTAVFVHSGNTLGVVPMHPSDKPGKTPLNLNQGVYAVQNGAIGRPIAVAAGQKWDVMKNTRGAMLSSGLTTATPPLRVNRTVPAASVPVRDASSGRGSSIVYDSSEHRFVNSSEARVAATPGAALTNQSRTAGLDAPTLQNNRTSTTTVANGPTARGTGVPSAPRATVSAPRPTVAPAAPHTSMGGSTSGSRWAGTGGSSGGGSGSSVGSSRPSGGSSSAGSSHPSGGGGRPH
jgi:hypothetical protein